MSFNIPRAGRVVQYETPATGSTITIGGGSNVEVFINPSGTVLALTCNLPSSPADGDKVTVSSSQIVTTFTMGNGTIVGALTTLAVATFASYTYFATPAKWVRTG